MGFVFVPRHFLATDMNPLEQAGLGIQSSAEQMLSTEKQEINHQLTLMFEWTLKTFLIKSYSDAVGKIRYKVDIKVRSY